MNMHNHRLFVGILQRGVAPLQKSDMSVDEFGC